MSKSSSTIPATISLGVAFWCIGLTYGGYFLILASTLSRTWSALASLITLYLVVVAPILMGVVAYKSRRARLVSTPYGLVFYAAAGYFMMLPLLFCIDTLLE
jgi:hypothetical protein